LTDFIDEINRLMPYQYLSDFQFPSFPSRNILGVAMTDESRQPTPMIRINDFYYPNNATRWSVFRGLATSSIVKKINEAVASSNGQTYGTFKINSVVKGRDSTKYGISTPLYMLPPRIIGETESAEGLYLITLVDERYFFQGTLATLPITPYSTWTDLIDYLAVTLGISVSYSNILESYQRPEPDSALWSTGESAAALLDAVAYNIGAIVVRNYDATYRLLSPSASYSIARSNRGSSSYSLSTTGNTSGESSTGVIRIAGGQLYPPAGISKAGNRTPFKNVAVPQQVNVTFPKYIVGNDPVPHFVNSRYRNPRSTSWIEDSYGSVYNIAVPIASGGDLVSGLRGVSQQYIHDTAKAVYNTEAEAIGTPLNYSGLVSLAMQVATDFYSYRIAPDLDETYPGIVNWTPEGNHDVIFTVSDRRRLAATRVIRPSWTLSVTELQHSTPPSSGGSYIVAGAGGTSVAQTYKDTTSFSGTLITTTLGASLASGAFTATFGGINHFPTQNRWRGQIENEKLLFEGTSGGTTVGIAQRGIDGTLQVEHDNGKTITWIQPDTAYGVNLVTFGKSQFIHPATLSSGGISEVEVLPQIQSVVVLDGTGAVLSGLTYHSGIVTYFNAAGANVWVSGELVWITERNSGIQLTQGTRYGAQLAGYNAQIGSLQKVAPVYLTNVGGGGGAAFYLTAKDQFGSSGTFRGLSGSSGYVFTFLGDNLLSGDNKASFRDVSYFPTQNRFRGYLLPYGSGLIPPTTLNSGEYYSGSYGPILEIVLFEGTSGGGTFLGAGCSVDIVSGKRGLDGTQQQLLLPSGSIVAREVKPHITSGINTITLEKSQFAYPQEVESGLTGVSLPSVTQSVMVLDGSGINVNNILHYSGRIVSHDSTQISGENWLKTDYVWIRERNDVPVFESGLTLSGPLSGGFRSQGYSGTDYSGMTFSGQWFSGTFINDIRAWHVRSGLIYNGQLTGYSKYVSGGHYSSPVYTVNDPETEFDVVVTDKWYPTGELYPKYSYIEAIPQENSDVGLYWRSSGNLMRSGGPAIELSGLSEKFPLYHENNIDLPTPLTTRVRQGDGKYFVAGSTPRWEIIKKTSVNPELILSSGSFRVSGGPYYSGNTMGPITITSGTYVSGSLYGIGGYYWTGELLRYDQHAKQFTSRELILIVDASLSG
jgi:hypothetical protein